MVCSLRFTCRNFLRRHKNGHCVSRGYFLPANNIQKMTESQFCISNYDAIGLDLDNTLVRYHLRPLLQLTFRSIIQFLTEQKFYPEGIKGTLEDCSDFFLKGLVLDKEKGNFLKLSNSHTIMKATHGTRLLSQHEIEDAYGRERVWACTTNFQEVMCEMKIANQSFFMFRDYFSMAIPFILARAIDLADESPGAEWTKPYSLLWEDILEGVRNMYHSEGFQKNQGEFFPTVRQTPSKYFYKCGPPFLDWLKAVRRTKKVFLLTSSNIDYARFLLHHSVGPDWKDYFDLVLTFAKKPGFFITNRSFFEVREDMETDVACGLSRGGIFSQGNWNDLKAFYAKECRRQEPKILYVGDSLVEDVLCPSAYTSCHCVAIVEEMAAEGMVGHVPDHPDASEVTSRFWGSFFCSELGEETLLSKVTRTHAKIAIPHLSVLPQIPLNKSIPCFSQPNIYGGFYPAVPQEFSIDH